LLTSATLRNEGGRERQQGKGLKPVFIVQPTGPVGGGLSSGFCFLGFFSCLGFFSFFGFSAPPSALFTLSLRRRFFLGRAGSVVAGGGVAPTIGSNPIVVGVVLVAGVVVIVVGKGIGRGKGIGIDVGGGGGINTLVGVIIGRVDGSGKGVPGSVGAAVGLLVVVVVVMVVVVVVVVAASVVPLTIGAGG